jgi:hypothetical protein
VHPAPVQQITQRAERRTKERTMTRSTKIRGLLGLLPAVLLLGAACGGGDKSPTGPDAPADGGQGPIDFQLTALGFAGLPADAQVEDCTLTRFYNGRIDIDPNSGEWQLSLQVHDKNYGDWGYKDWGQSEGNATTVLFESDITGTTHQATVNGDGTEVKIMYDWCEDGVGDVQLVFDR